MELTNEVYNSVNRYFSVLSHTGYKSYDDVDKLLVFTFLEEFLYGPLSQFVTEKGYNTINSSLYCLYGSCMIPFPDYKKSFDSVVNRIPNGFRLTESEVNRYADNLELRLID